MLPFARLRQQSENRNSGIRSKASGVFRIRRKQNVERMSAQPRFETVNRPDRRENRRGNHAAATRERQAVGGEQSFAGGQGKADIQHQPRPPEPNLAKTAESRKNPLMIIGADRIDVHAVGGNFRVYARNRRRPNSAQQILARHRKHQQSVATGPDNTAGSVFKSSAQITISSTRYPAS